MARLGDKLQYGTPGKKEHDLGITSGRTERDHLHVAWVKRRTELSWNEENVSFIHHEFKKVLSKRTALVLYAT